jgi:hypothetical protein
MVGVLVEEMMGEVVGCLELTAGYCLQHSAGKTRDAGKWEFEDVKGSELVYKADLCRA